MRKTESIKSRICDFGGKGKQTLESRVREGEWRMKVVKAETSIVEGYGKNKQEIIYSYIKLFTLSLR